MNGTILFRTSVRYLIHERYDLIPDQCAGEDCLYDLTDFADILGFCPT